MAASVLSSEAPAQIIAAPRGSKNAPNIRIRPSVLIVPLNQLPVMTRGRGVILQRYAKGDLADITTLNAKEGLTWRAGQQGTRTEPNIKRWIGKRAQAGLVVPKGFARANKFT